MNKDEIQKKANILIDALPYIRDFAGKIVVICYSCVNLLSEDEEKSLMRDIALLKSIGMKPVVVHDIHYGVDRYRENKRIAKMLENCGNKSIGLSGIDLDALGISLDNDYIPVVTPNDIDTEDMILYPENIACEAAIRLRAEKLVFLSENKGFFVDNDENKKLLPMVLRDEATAYVKQFEGSLSESFRRQINNSVAAIDKGVGRAHIIDGLTEHSLLLEFFSIDGIGSVIIRDHSKYYSHEKTGLPR